jgi:hypothetical protein
MTPRNSEPKWSVHPGTTTFNSNLHFATCFQLDPLLKTSGSILRVDILLGGVTPGPKIQYPEDASTMDPVASKAVAVEPQPGDHQDELGIPR